MNAIRNDPDAELEHALILWLIATGDLSAHLERKRGVAPDRRRIVLEILDARLGQARAAAEDAVATTLFSHP